MSPLQGQPHRLYHPLQPYVGKATTMRLFVILFIMLFCFTSSDSRAQDGDQKRVLAILGDGWHRVAPLDRHLVGKLRDDGWQAVVIMDYDVPWDEFEEYDLIILSREGHEFVQNYRLRDVDPDHERGYWLTKEQSLRFEEYVSNGGRMLLYHDGFGNYPCDFGPALIARSCFISHPPITQIEVTATGTMPELTEGIGPFVVSDEEYKVQMDESETNVFLESHSRENGRSPQGWAHTYDEGKVVVLVPGHRQATIEHPAINRIVQNAFDWLLE